MGHRAPVPTVLIMGSIICYCVKGRLWGTLLRLPRRPSTLGAWIPHLPFSERRCLPSLCMEKLFVDDDCFQGPEDSLLESTGESVPVLG